MKSKRFMILFTLFMISAFIITIIVSITFYDKFCSSRVGGNAICTDFTPDE